MKGGMGRETAVRIRQSATRSKIIRRLPLPGPLPIVPRIGIEIVVLVVVEGSIEGIKPRAYLFRRITR